MSPEATEEIRTQRIQIHEAIKDKNHDSLKLLLSKASINAINSRQIDKSALDLAVHLGDEVAVELLFANGAVPNCDQPHRHSWFLSTLSWAIRNPPINEKIFQLLLNHGCDPDTAFEDTVGWHDAYFPHTYWHKIVEQDNLPVFQFLLKCKNREIGNDDWSKKMLLTACGFGSIVIMEYLLQKLSIETADKNGWTCLFYAMFYKRFQIIQLLISRGANLKHKDSVGRNLLHMAVSNYELPPKKNEYLDKLLELIELLINDGLEINATDDKNLTPVNTALVNKTHYLAGKIIEPFLKHPDIDLAIPDIDGVTVLHRIIPTGRQDILFNLLRRPNIDVNARDLWGRRPLQLFIDCRGKIFFWTWTTFQLLIEYGADTDVLDNLKKDINEEQDLFKVLMHYKIKRSLAGLNEDENVNALLSTSNFVLSEEKRKELVSKFSTEIEQMKKAIIYDEFTFYDLLHATRYTCIDVAKRIDKQEMLKYIFHDYKFEHYTNMLIRNYVYGMKQLKLNESEAIDSSEKNLDVVLNDMKLSVSDVNAKKNLNA